MYCDFHFSTRLQYKPALVESIRNEINLQQDYLKGEPLHSVYFGGGTPSVLSAEELKAIFQSINEHFEVLPDAEITLEANPDDLSPTKLEELAQSPVNRLSIGIQSFDDDDLKFMNRSHNARQALDVVANARKSGFDNLTIDLIYGVPGRDEEHWQKQLQQALELEVPHISAYALTVEKETLLEHWIKKGEVSPLDEDMAQRHFNMLRTALQDAGYEHYEISNFAKPGHRAVHNSSYWEGKTYLGLGPSAHSFDGLSRQWNVSNNHLYMSSLQQDELNFQREDLSPADRYNEMVMTALRRREGIDLKRVDQDFGVHFTEYLMEEAQPLLNEGKLSKKKNRLAIADDHRFYSDGIASSLFYI